MSSLFGLTQEFRALEALSNELEINEETGEIIDRSEDLKSLFDELEVSFIHKLDAAQYIRKGLDSNADTLASEIKRLQMRKKALENRSERLKALMLESMLVSGESKLKGNHSFSLGTRKVLKLDENLTPDFFDKDYIRTKKEFDKKKITDDLKNGAIIEGAKIVETINFSIR